MKKEKPSFLTSIAESQMNYLYDFADILHKAEIYSFEDYNLHSSVKISEDLFFKLRQFYSSLFLLSVKQGRYIIDKSFEKEVFQNILVIQNDLKTYFHTELEEYEIIEFKFKIWLLSAFQNYIRENEMQNYSIFSLVYQIHAENLSTIFPSSFSIPKDKNDSYFSSIDSRMKSKFKFDFKLALNSNKFRILFELYNYLNIVFKDISGNFHLNINPTFLNILIVSKFKTDLKKGISIPNFCKKLSQFIPFDERWIKINKIPNIYYFALINLVENNSNIKLSNLDDEMKIRWGHNFSLEKYQEFNFIRFIRRGEEVE